MRPTDRRDDQRSSAYSAQDHYGHGARSPWPSDQYEGMDFRRQERDVRRTRPSDLIDRRDNYNDYPGEAYRNEGLPYNNIRDGGYQYADREHEEFIPDNDRDQSTDRRRRRTGEARQQRRYRSNEGFGLDLTRPGSEHYERGGGPRFGENQFKTTSEFEDEIPNYRGKGPTAYKRSDERISDDLHECLTEHAGVDATHIEIKVEGGVVTLSGHVPDRWMKYQAEEMAEHVKGVVSVDNRITLAKNNVNLRPSERP